MKKGFSHLKCGLLGEHLGHSFSPQIHALLADYSYGLFEVEHDGVENFVKCCGLDAYNVTIPYKKAVMPFLDVISPEALSIGSVNTVVRGNDGRLYGYNTDYFGFDYMLTSSKIDPKGKKTLVFGAGGASVTVCSVLRDRGVRELRVIGRNENTPEYLANHTDAQIIVNTTPVGMYPKNILSPVDLSIFPDCVGVLDVIYNPARTALLIDAEKRGIVCSGGLSMLVAQAVKAFELFTGERAEDRITDKIIQEVASTTQNIILIGMPGCGKSTVGKILADKLKRPFYDADDAFLAIHGKTPADVIRDEGEPEFRLMENLVLRELGKQSGAVIACGGGAVTRSSNYAPLHQNGVMVFIERDLKKLATNGRPLSQKHTVEELYNARIDAYHSFADIEIKSTEIPEKTAELIISSLNGYRYIR